MQYIIHIPVWIACNKRTDLPTMFQSLQEAGENAALPFSRCSLKQIQAFSPSTKLMYLSLQCNLCSKEPIHGPSSLCPDFCAVGNEEFLQNCSSLPWSVPTQTEPKFRRALQKACPYLDSNGPWFAMGLIFFLITGSLVVSITLVSPLLYVNSRVPFHSPCALHTMVFVGLCFTSAVTLIQWGRKKRPQK